MRVLRTPVTLFGSVLCAGLFAQTAPDTYWVQFTDKDNTPYTLSEPEQFLSARAIARRQAQGTTLDMSDLPVDPAYIAGVLATGPVQLVNQSKWFNAITIRTSDGTALAAIEALPFVSHVRGVRRLMAPLPEEMPVAPTNEQRDIDPAAYGDSWTQIYMLNGHLLHEINAQGQGMLIGVLDSGFEDADSLAGFDSLRTRNGILLTRDMVNHDGDVYDDHWHGRSVLSCMTGILPGYLRGTAPLADYVLLRTEEVANEFVVEEDNWVAGAELCDSLGCDVLNTSLGYTEFDSTFQNHVYADLDGATSRISIAAGMASQKGMIPVCSAGNNGGDAWHFIGVPADAIDILAVGAVGTQGQHAPFSSFGPSADGRVKPDVCTMGWGAIGLRIEGDSIAPISGTSFSSPILAGLVACLWQLHPDRTGHEVMQAVRESASLYLAPNDSMGYGIPDFFVAHHLLTLLSTNDASVHSDLRIYPIPFSDHLVVDLPDAHSPITISLCDATGRTVLIERLNVMGGRIDLTGPSLAALAPGGYLLIVDGNDARQVHRVVKR